jgi:hypothetical protein
LSHATRLNLSQNATRSYETIFGCPTLEGLSLSRVGFLLFTLRM